MQITQWKRVALEELPKVLSNRRGTKSKDEEALKAALYQQIGQLKVELDWLKKTTVVKLIQRMDVSSSRGLRGGLRRDGLMRPTRTRPHAHPTRPT
jgi:hypothetical protein